MIFFSLLRFFLLFSFILISSIVELLLSTCMFLLGLSLLFWLVMMIGRMVFELLIFCRKVMKFYGVVVFCHGG